MVMPTYSSGFDLPDEDIYLLKIKEVKFVEVEGKGLTAKVSNTIEEGKSSGSEFIGMMIFDNFPLYTKFGLARFLGLMVKAIDLPEKDYDENYFVDAKKQQQVSAKSPGNIYGGRVVHTKSKQSDNVFANLKEYYTRNEYRIVGTSGKVSKITGDNIGGVSVKEEVDSSW